MGFDETQERSLHELGAKLVRAIASSSLKKGAGYQAEPPLDPGSIEFANTFGILGPRGAGKSTILRGLYERRANFKLPSEAARKFKDLFLMPPLDCSVVAGDVAPGAAILLHLEDHLKAREIPPGKKAAVTGILSRLDDLAGRYSSATEPFRNLGVELASSLGDYTHFILSGMRDRLHLRDDLKSWLEEALDIFDAEAFVVLLDDFDLVYADEVRRWILSLLDELHQRQLLFVLTADFYRLEHLNLNPKAEFDDLTARALLDKLLPTQNRLNIDRWGLISRNGFQLAEASGQTIELGRRIQRFALESPAQKVLLKRLLPGWPRGLVNLYRSLEEDRQRSEIIHGDPREATASNFECRGFLSLLASCRGEPLLARELKEIPLGSWARTLQFSRRDLSVEEWQETVEVASKRSLSTEEVQPLLGLMPVLATPSPLVASQDEWTGYKNHSELHLEQAAVYDSLRHDPSWRDPLRHDDLHIRPLRDAKESAQPYWAELLLNFAFAFPDSPEAIRNRVHFLETWLPAVSRLKRAQIHVALTRRALREFFEDAEPAIPRASLLWMSWKPEEPSKETAVVNFGWHPFLSGLRGARDPLLSRQLTDLLINPADFGGDLPGIGTTQELMLIPDHLSAMILLIEGLDRCPWNAFSTPLAWLVRTYIALAAAFVRTAYVFAMKTSGVLALTDLSKPQLRMVGVLEQRDPLNLLRLREEEVLAWIADLFADDLATKLESAQSSLSRAALAFLHSRTYTCVQDLLPAATAVSSDFKPLSEAGAA